MRALVTGGAGFIGSHLVDRLLSDGWQVHVIDDLSHGTKDNLDSALASAECALSVQDITDLACCETVIDFGPDVVFHLAAQIDVRQSVTDPIDDARINVLGTVRLLDAARRAGARKVVLASSVAVYGTVERLPVVETDPATPFSPYGVSKLAGEQYVWQYQRMYGLPGAVLYLGNVYGPRQDPRGEAGVVSIFADALLDGRPTRVFGDGGNTRDYVYVADVADALVRAATPAGDGGRFNVGSGIPTSDLELHRVVVAAAGVAREPGFAAERPGDLRAITLDSSAATAQLGWQPTTALGDGAARTVRWVRERRWPGEGIRHVSS